jgi:hypothetical protein
MRRSVLSAGLRVLAAAAAVSSCSSPGSPGTAAASASVVVVGSPATVSGHAADRPPTSAPASPRPVPPSSLSPKLPDYTPPDVSAPPRVSEIFTSHESPLTQADFKVNNAWQGPGSTTGQWLVVYAGESMTDRVPALVVYALPTDPNVPGQDPSLIGLYRDANATGPLQITAASGQILTVTGVTAAGGAPSQQTFDTATAAYGTPLVPTH